MLSLIAAIVIAGPQDVKSTNFAFQSSLKTLVVFKEGFGFYVREGTANLENGWATTNLVPQASRGTFWVYPLNAADRVETVVTTNDNRIEFDSPADIKAKLANKTGLKMEIVSQGDVKAVGTLRNVLDDMLLLKEDSGGFKAVEYKTIKTISLVDFPVRFKLNTKSPNGSAGIGIAYVQPGVRWEPSYMMELSQKDTARLTLRGTLLGLPEELKKANLVFVIGAPNLLDVGQVDWLLQGFMTHWLKEEADKGSVAAPGAEFASKSADSARGLGGGGGGGGFGGGGGNFPPPIQESGELQYYNKPNFSLRPGERAMTTIFESDVTVKPFFEWNADGENVDYIVKLINTTGHPFTIGPVFVVEDLRPVGQASMKYTANGDEAELRMARAVGIKVEAAQTEETRGQILAIGETKFLPITMRGTLSVENFRDKEVEVRIKRTVNGKIIEVLNGGVVKNTTQSAISPNATNSLEWTIKVPARTKTQVSYRFDSYVLIGK